MVHQNGEHAEYILKTLCFAQLINMKLTDVFGVRQWWRFMPDIRGGGDEAGGMGDSPTGVPGAETL